MLEFTSDMLYVQKATKDLECLAVFSADDVWFQENKLGEKIEEESAKDGGIGFSHHSAMKSCCNDVFSA